jgi:pimeloyl-ACP methyl ester carboxylesterase
LRAQVRFDRAIATLTAEPAVLVLEVGAANTLTSLLTAGFPDRARHRAIPLLAVPQGENAHAGDTLRRVPGLLWAQGIEAPTEKAPENLPAAMDLPTYPFQRRRCWIDPPGQAPASAARDGRSSEVAMVAATTASTIDQVIALVAEMSGIAREEIQPDRTFSALGFESIFMVQFAERLSSVGGCHISHARVSEHNTAARLAAFIDGQRPAKSEATPTVPSTDVPRRLAGRRFRGLFNIRKGDGTIPLLFIHGDRANDLLQEHLPPEQSIWGYVHQAADGEPFQFDTVETLAENCLCEWSEAVGKQPCVLAGHSFGGQVAYELARKLRQRQVEVLHLFVVESLHPRVLRHLYGFGLKWPLTIARILRNFVQSFADIGRGDSHIRRGEKIPVSLRTPYILGKYDVACARYFPGPLDVEATVFSVTRNASDMPNNGYTAADLATMKNIVIDGDHVNIINEAPLFEPIGREIALRLRHLHTQIAAAKGA